MKKLLFSTLPLLLIIFSCSNESKTVYPISDDIVQVKSGQSFGMCIGKCTNEIIITGDKMTLKQIERKERGGDTSTYEFTENANLQQVLQEIKKINQAKFLALEDVYGCPDCADGGAEWVEITFKGKEAKKVTFEYGKTIPGFEELVSTLSTNRLSIIEKHK
jgi:hypothetical protein